MIQNPHLLPSQELLIEILDLDQDTGTLTWKKRDRRHFPSDQACLAWNAKLAGREALAYSDLRGYKVGHIFSRRYRAHRVIWCMVHGRWPTAIDHIDGDTSNNSISNLREASQQENMRNISRRTDNTSGFSGVCWATRDEKWRAYIENGGKRIWLGDFKSKRKAVAARAAAEKKYGFHENHGRDPI